MQRLLLLTSSLPPTLTGETPALLHLCKYLPEHGWEPRVLAIPPVQTIPRDEHLTREIPPTVRVISVPGTPRKPSLPPVLTGLLQLPDSLASLRKVSLNACLEQVQRERPKAVMPLVPSHTLNLIALDVSRKAGIPLIPYFRSLWGGNPWAVWTSPLQKRLHQLLEARVVHGSAGLVATSEGAAGYFMERYPGICPPHHVSENAYDPGRVVPAGPLDRGDTLKLGWVGSFRGGRSPERALMGFAEFFRRNPDARVRIEHAGNVSPDHLPRMRQAEDRVHLRGSLPWKAVPEFLASSHVLFFFQAPGKDSHRTSPTMASECLRTGRPIMAAAPEGDMSQRLRTLGNAYVCPPDPLAMASTFENVYEHWRKGLLRTPLDPRKISDHLDATVTMKLLAAFLNRTAG